MCLVKDRSVEWTGYGESVERIGLRGHIVDFMYLHLFSRDRDVETDLEFVIPVLL